MVDRTDDGLSYVVIPIFGDSYVTLTEEPDLPGLYGVIYADCAGRITTVASAVRLDAAKMAALSTLIANRR